MTAIEKSIRDSDLGVNPSNDGHLIRVTLPELTQERRKEYIKLARHKAEDARISIRGHRRTAKEALEAMVKNKEVGEDDVVRAEKQLDAATKRHTDVIDDVLEAQRGRTPRGVRRMSEVSGGDPSPPVVCGPGRRHPPPSQKHGRAGRNLASAIGVGVGLGAYVVLTLMFFKPGFVALVAVALALGSIELWTRPEAARDDRRRSSRSSSGSCRSRPGPTSPGQQTPVVFSTTSVLLASLALTVLAALVWRIPRGRERLRHRRRREPDDHRLRTAARFVRAR